MKFVAKMALFAGLTWTSISSAGNLTGAVISNVLVTKDGHLILTFSTTRPAPACGAALNYRYVISQSNKTAIAAALMAHAAGRQVEVIGTDNCDVWADTESVLYLRVY